MNCCYSPTRLMFGTACLLTAASGHAQDVHYAQVQDMKIWYNPSLKINKETEVQAGIQSVKYPGIMAYSGKALSIELPVMSGERDEQDNRSFVNLAFGIKADNSSGISVQVSAAMMALSWALPLNYDNTYLAAGLQAGYTFSRIGYDGYLTFPDNFDRNGPIALAIFNDPARTGYTYQYFTAGAGATVFHSDTRRQWYAGGSIRHFNQPATDRYDAGSARLPLNYGIQGGYSTGVSEHDVIGGYGNFIWQAGNYEHTIGALYTRNLEDSANISVSLGVACRPSDAIIPNAGFEFRAYRIHFFYEFNTAGRKSTFNRKSFELSIKVNL